MRRPPARRAVPGFTLVEVLVALAIVAVTLLACVRAMGTMAQSGAELRLRLLAQLSAQNRIAFLRASHAFPPAGTTSVDCTQGGVALQCRQEIQSTPNPVFMRVEVRVHVPQTPAFALASLSTVLAREP